jgi:hypothetical protein
MLECRLKLPRIKLAWALAPKHYCNPEAEPHRVELRRVAEQQAEGRGHPEVSSNSGRTPSTHM